MADDVQVPSGLVKSILSPLLQPGATLGQTQQSTATSGQEQATSAQEQANLSVQNQSLQSQAAIDKLKQQQAYASVNLGKDLQNGASWDQVRHKYTALGMSADDVFKQYLENNQHGTPVESPDTLITQGVKPETLGAIGQPGSFNDKYNTKNAINEIRTAQNLWNKITPQDILQQKVFGKNENINNYLSYKTTLGNHLQSLIPGASGAQATGQQLLSQLPDPGNITNFGGKIATGAFNTLENSLLTQKGYSQKELGLGKNTQGSSNTGSELLNNMLNTVKTSNEVVHNPLGVLAASQIKSGVNDAIDTTNKVNQDISNAPKSGNPLTDALSATGIMAKDTITPSRIVGDVVASVGARYLPTVLSKIIGDGSGEATVGMTTPKGAPETPNTPNSFMTKLNPQGTKDAGSAIRNQAVTLAEKNGKTIPGDNIVKGVQQWADLASKANPGEEAKIQATVDSVTKQYAGKQINPSDAVKIYNEVDSGFTRTGVTKENIQGSRDIALRNILGKELDTVTGGKWAHGTSTIAKGFQADKGQIAQIKKNLAPRAVSAGLGIAGLDSIRHLLGL